MKTLKLMIAGLFVFGPLAANADIIEVSDAGAASGEWDITLITDSFNDVEGTLDDQVWWNDGSLALKFASAYIAEYPFSFYNPPGFPAFGPYFAFNSYSEEVCDEYGFSWTQGLYCKGYIVVDYAEFAATGGAVGILAFEYDTNRLDENRVWATAARVAAVPEPGTLALLGLGLLGVGVARRRKA